MLWVLLVSGPRATRPTDDGDIVTIRVNFPCRVSPVAHHFERAHQDGRVYYRLVSTYGTSSGVFTTAAGAREDIAYWREKGWLVADQQVTA